MAPKRKRTGKSMPSNKNAQPSPSPVASASITPNPSDPNSPIYFWRPQETTTGYLSQWFPLPFREETDPSKIYLTAEHYMMHHKALLFGDDEIAASILEATSPRDVRNLGRAVRGFDAAVWENERERIVKEGTRCKFTLPVLQDEDTKEGVVEEEEEEEGKKAKAKGKVDGKKSNDEQRTDDDDGKEEEQADTKDNEDGLKTWRLGNDANAQTIRAASFRDVLLATGKRELVEASPFDRIWGIGFAAKSAEGKRQKWGTNLLGKCLMEVREEFRMQANLQSTMLETGEDV
ncbi:DUF1768-domain-containing protein [Xylariaceae sp. AK1471]|nr:DUF1768-domain-containing protein [Xylariaceae sp. AK1471]